MGVADPGGRSRLRGLGSPTRRKLRGVPGGTAPRDNRWRARPGLSRLITVIVFVVPICAALAGTLLVNALLPTPHGVIGHVLWWFALLAGGIIPMQLALIVMRRWLPLAMLLRLSLAFPDKAPSRYDIAKRANRTRDLHREVWAARAAGDSSTRIQAASQVLALVSAVGDHDRATRGHSERVRVFTDMLADEMRLDSDERERLRWASLLHDVGKLSVPEDVLNKPGKPDDHEWDIIRRHPLFGVRIMDPLRSWLGPWIGAVEQHHERFDGSGYPLGLAGERISLGGRMVAVTDSFEVMTAARAYKRPMSVADARKELVNCAGRHFDPAVVRAFLGISPGRMRWFVGIGALVAQLPVIGYLSYKGIPQRIGRSVATAATTTTVVMAAAVMGPLQLAGLGGAHVAGERVTVAGTQPATGAGEATDDRQLASPDGPHPQGGGGGDEVTGVRGDGTPSSTGGTGAPPAEAPGDQPGTPKDDHRTPGDPRDPPNEPEEPSEPYVAFGRTELPGLLGAGTNFTGSEFRARCATPSSQGLDAWVFRIPSSEGDRRVDVDAVSGVGNTQMQAIAYSTDCTELASYSGPALGDVAVPSATGYLLLSTPSAAHVGLRLRMTST